MTTHSHILIYIYDTSISSTLVLAIRLRNVDDTGAICRAGNDPVEIDRESPVATTLSPV